MSEKQMDFFTDADKNKTGKNSSTYPAWMHETQLEDLRESIRQKEYALDNDLVIASERGIQKDRLRREKVQLDRIEGSRPDFDDATRDRLSKVRKALGSEIGRAMYTRDEMRTGTANAHEEARRISTPCISVKSEDMLDVIKGCGVDRITTDGKITRGQAEKAWRIISRYLGENSNTETLRKEK